MAEWPTFSEEDRGGRIGVHVVGVRVHKDLRWIFRETSASDIGIDGEIELREANETSHGRLIAVQVKCGRSFLSEKSTTGFVYRGSLKHLRYWANRTVPVIVVLCDPEAETCWWAAVALQDVELHEKGWSIEVPFANTLTSASSDALRGVASRLQQKDLIELLLRDWLCWRYEFQIRIASTLDMPRDFHWLSTLANAGDEYLMIDYVTSNGIDEFKVDEIADMHHWAVHNHAHYGYGVLLLAFVSESPLALARMPDPPPSPGIRVEYVPLLLDLRGEPSLRERGADGVLVAFYSHGEALDDGVRVVPSAVKRSGP